MFIDYIFCSFFIFFAYQSCLAAGYFYLRYLRSSKRRQTKQVKPIVINFEDKYLEQYNTLEPVFLSDERLSTLKNTLLFENTPLGNLIMFYNHSRESFTYYSDNTIPYRFLEVASRHYVVQNNCKSIHVNMLEELSDSEKRMQEKKEQQKQEKEQKQEQQKQEQQKQEKEQKQEKQPKKNVFAKLKNYNTGSVRAPNATTQKSGSINGRPPPNSNVKTNNDTNIIVKEKANRYSYEGKLSNFSFLKKVESKLTNKFYDMSFTEFMKIQKPCN